MACWRGRCGRLGLQRAAGDVTDVRGKPGELARHIPVHPNYGIRSAAGMRDN